jgi:inositol phosphorylceramide mannosyltransferase catalytic subunit
MAGGLEIPRKIYQIWRNQTIPLEWERLVQSWKRFHPDWEYRLWTDIDSRSFVEEHYPGFLETYDSFSYDIQRADVMRYLLLHTYGGVYVDLDFECLRPLGGLLAGRTFVAGFEPSVHASWHGEARVVCNAFLAAAKGHPFLAAVINACKNLNPRITFHHEVLSTTGPIMLTRVWESYSDKDITILDDYVVYPFTGNSHELRVLTGDGPDGETMKELCVKNGSYAIHYWANSWVRNLAGPLTNPEPHSVEGYVFYQGLDSIGFDIGNVGRDIQTLVRECNRNENAVGFNTDGFLKFRLQARHKWVRIGTGENEGLYVKKRVLPLLR